MTPEVSSHDQLSAAEQAALTNGGVDLDRATEAAARLVQTRCEYFECGLSAAAGTLLCSRSASCEGPASAIDELQKAAKYRSAL